MQGFSHHSLDLPALFLRKRKISFTRQIAEQASPTGPYKSFFNQRPLRLGATTPREHRCDTSTPPNTSLSFYPPLFHSSASSAFVLVINKLKATTHSAQSPTWTLGQPRCQVGGWKKKTLSKPITEHHKGHLWTHRLQKVHSLISVGSLRSSDVAWITRCNSLPAES